MMTATLLCRECLIHCTDLMRLQGLLCAQGFLVMFFEIASMRC